MFSYSKNNSNNNKIRLNINTQSKCILATSGTFTQNIQKYLNRRFGQIGILLYKCTLNEFVAKFIINIYMGHKIS